MLDLYTFTTQGGYDHTNSRYINLFQCIETSSFVWTISNLIWINTVIQTKRRVTHLTVWTQTLPNKLPLNTIKGFVSIYDIRIIEEE